MVHIIVRPVGGEIVLMEGSGHGSFASVAELITVDIGVGGKLALLTAEAAVPVGIFSGFPSGAKLMLVEVRRDGSFANIA